MSDPGRGAPMTGAELQVSALEEKNANLTRALLAAREQLRTLHDQLDRVSSPPAHIGVYVQAHPDRHEVEVIIGGRPMRIATAPEFDYDNISSGQLVRINEKNVAVEAMEFPREGALASVLELLGTERVLVAVDGSTERVVTLAGPLRHGNLKPGDTVLVDVRTGFAFERVVRSHVEQLLTPEVPDVSYSDIGGLDQQIEQVRDAVELPFQHPELFADYDLRPPRGILLYGPPGTGKTLIAKAVAASLADAESEHKPYFISVKGPELLNKYVGETERHIRSIFARARSLASSASPVVVFFDEMEALFRTRGSGVSSDVETMIVPQLLAEMDGLEEIQNVVVIGASNRPDMIDPAVLRPGRLDVRIRVRRPGREEARDIFSKHLTADLPIAPELIAEAGGAQAAVHQMIDASIALLYSRDDEAMLFDLELADGSHRRVYMSDLVSGAMIAGAVKRAKAHAIKETISDGGRGLATAHVLRGVREEMRESAELASTTSPDEWARTVGLRGGKVLSVIPVDPVEQTS